MSITYDPEKWSSPTKARDFDPPRKKTQAQVLVSLRELRYFKEHPEMLDGKPGAMSTFFEDEDFKPNPDVGSAD